MQVDKEYKEAIDEAQRLAVFHRRIAAALGELRQYAPTRAAAVHLERMIDANRGMGQLFDSLVVGQAMALEMEMQTGENREGGRGRTH